MKRHDTSTAVPVTKCRRSLGCGRHHACWAATHVSVLRVSLTGGHFWKFKTTARCRNYSTYVITSLNDSNRVFLRCGLSSCVMQPCVTYILFRTGRIVGPDSSVGMATRYGLEDPEIEYRGRCQTGPRAHSASCLGYRVSFPGLGRPGRGVNPYPHLRPRSKKEWSCTSTPFLGLYGRL